jgi:hypothetical protein
MRNAIGLAGALVLLFAPVAKADAVKLAKGGELQGSVQEITFQVKDVKSAYPREELAAVRVAEDGKDQLELQDGTKLAGKLVSVSFQALGGLRPLSREKLESVTFDAATTVDALKAKQKEDAEKAEEQKPEWTDEQKAGFTKNRELYKKYTEDADKAEKDEKDALKKKYTPEVQRVVSEIQRLERSIEDKLRARDAASRNTTTRTTGYGNEYDRVARNDGLERDQQALEKAKRDAAKLKSTIRSEQSKNSDRAKLRESRLESAAGASRKKITDGQIPTEEDMKARYDAAFKLPGDKDTKPKAAAKSGG